MVGFKRSVFLAVLACGGAEISPAATQAQQGQDLFLRCTVVKTCEGPGFIRCGQSTEVRSYRVSFRQGTISELSGDQRTYRMT